MENNKLLIGVQFTDKDVFGRDQHTNIELYVVRDITLQQLMDGIRYGLEKLSKSDSADKNIYARCFATMSKCLSATFLDVNGQPCFRNITFTSFNAAVIDRKYSSDMRFAFSLSDIEKPLCDLGFITSSRIIFDATGSFMPHGMLNTNNIVQAFNPQTSQKIFFPEFNISTRQLYQFNRTPVNVIAPTEPPHKMDRSLFATLLPSIISVAVMLLMRLAMAGGGTSSIVMALLSVGMCLSALISTVISYRRQKKEYAENLSNWRMRYENYIDSLFLHICDRQQCDVQKLEELYPDMLTLINPDEQGIYAMNEHIYSRSPQDADFLTFRIGRSNQVMSFFDINGDDKDVVFSEAFFDIVQDRSGFDRLRIFLRDELSEAENNKENLCKLPHTMAQQYAHLENAPLLYSLKNKRCLGVVDQAVDSLASRSSYFISRMIFELCYYHSPEDLQFVMFFNEDHNWDSIETTINRYKFMPHFRGLFQDKSQFVFDKNSAHLVMSTLLTMLNERREKGVTAATPHIVMVVFDEHGLKEHAFAEYLPKAPAEGEPYTNELGMSFVFVTKYKEYLPAYCDDIVSFESSQMALTPHQNVIEKQVFTYDHLEQSADPRSFYMTYTQNVTRALRFFSSIHYAQIAQNGRVPSAVSMFDVINPERTALDRLIRANWGFDGKRSLPSVTESLCVPIGKTESGFAFLDLHEKADGPHMLVAGTTGSGKTETIISFLLSLCMQYRPDELNLLLVDMKGGGFTNRIGHLPHVVGAVTDVDGDENGTSAEYMLGRFLNAMKSEIKRRKLLFNKLHVDSIDGYILACKDIEAHIEQKKLTGEDAVLARKAASDESLAHLILVVDEFTELKRFSNENGGVDFMGEITTIARVGRSLGFHIILISQNIEGAITDDIRANSSARLCLKVATRQASKDMIGTELAASAYMPGNGRAYLLVGTGKKFEYFQSAYSGSDVEESIPIEISLASKTGPYFNFYRSDKDHLAMLQRLAEQKKAGTAKSQLEAICEAICTTYSEYKSRFAEHHMVFSSPLPTCIAWDSSTHRVIDLSKRKQVK